MSKYDESEIRSIEDLKQAMESHAADAETLYKKAVAFKVLDEQFFINWQDELNVHSFTREEDLN